MDDGPNPNRGFHRESILQLLAFAGFESSYYFWQLIGMQVVVDGWGFFCLGACGCGTAIAKRDMSFWVEDWALHVTNGCDKTCGHGATIRRHERKKSVYNDFKSEFARGAPQTK